MPTKRRGSTIRIRSRSGMHDRPQFVIGRLPLVIPVRHRNSAARATNHVHDFLSLSRGTSIFCASQVKYALACEATYPRVQSLHLASFTVVGSPFEIALEQFLTFRYSVRPLFCWSFRYFDFHSHSDTMQGSGKGRRSPDDSRSVSRLLHQCPTLSLLTPAV